MPIPILRIVICSIVIVYNLHTNRELKRLSSCQIQGKNTGFPDSKIYLFYIVWELLCRGVHSTSCPHPAQVLHPLHLLLLPITSLPWWLICLTAGCLLQQNAGTVADSCMVPPNGWYHHSDCNILKVCMMFYTPFTKAYSDWVMIAAKHFDVLKTIGWGILNCNSPSAHSPWKSTLHGWRTLKCEKDAAGRTTKVTGKNNPSWMNESSVHGKADYHLVHLLYI